MKRGPAAPGPQMALLNRQLALKRRHMAVRRLLAEFAETAQCLKPCMLMSPLPVAQYLEPGRLRFDVVIFDEASQIAPWDALGAIARASQIIVVGDDKQLPPTSFLSRGDDDEDLDETDVQDAESILDELVAGG